MLLKYINYLIPSPDYVINKIQDDIYEISKKDEEFMIITTSYKNLKKYNNYKYKIVIKKIKKSIIFYINENPTNIDESIFNFKLWDIYKDHEYCLGFKDKKLNYYEKKKKFIFICTPEYIKPIRNKYVKYYFLNPYNFPEKYFAIYS